MVGSWVSGSPIRKCPAKDRMCVNHWEEHKGVFSIKKMSRRKIGWCESLGKAQRGRELKQASISTNKVPILHRWQSGAPRFVTGGISCS